MPQLFNRVERVEYVPAIFQPRPNCPHAITSKYYTGKPPEGEEVEACSICGAINPYPNGDAL